MDTQEPKTREEQETFVQHCYERAEQLRKEKAYKEGIQLLVEALKFGLRKEMLYYRLGNLYIDGGDLARAEYAYKRALAIDPHHANAMHNLAIIYKRQKKTALFVRTYKKAQRTRLRYPRKADLTPAQTERARRLGRKMLLWILVGGGALILILVLLLR
jgi:tetratricopeptide (TPR) repeat protein